MSTIIQVKVPSPATKGFQVEYVESCIIMRGPVPVDVFVALADTLPKEAIVSARLAKCFGASFVAGLPEDLERLSAVAPSMPLALGAERLPKDAITWLQTGARGASSEAMFDAAFNGHFASGHDGTTATPGDVSDFVRCRLMVEQVAQVAAHLDRVAQLSPNWARVITAWPELCAMIDSEVVDYRVGTYAAPQTEALMATLYWSEKP